MRLSRAIGAVVLLLTPVYLHADDFLSPENWDGLKEYWKIDGDTIVGSTENVGDGKGLKFNTFLCSKKKYKDFELTFQVRLKKHIGNSGVQIRSKLLDEQKKVVGGPQCDIGAGYWGSLYGERFGGMMKASDPKAINPKLKPDDFNDYSIRCVGKKVTITVNGVVAIDQEFDKLPDEGIIAWQLHAGPPMEVTFRNIKFAEIVEKK